jgi:hypothetical protein
MPRAIVGVISNPSSEQWADLEAFLGVNPNADAIRQFIRKPSHQLFYDEASETATYVTVSGASSICFMIQGVAKILAQEIYKGLSVPRVNSAAWMSFPEFQMVVQRVLGFRLDITWYKSS